MPNIPDKILSGIIDHTVDLHRYDAGLQKVIRAMLDQLARDLAAQLTSAGLDAPRTDWQRARLTALLNDANETIGEAYGNIASLASEEIRGMIQVTGDVVTTAINDSLGSKLMIPVKWTPELLEKLADGTLIHGAPSADWWARQAQDLEDAFADQMRLGMLRGETVAQIRDRILGQPIPGVGAVGKVDLRKVEPALRPPIWTARRNAEALVRTSVISAANAAHMASYEANSDIVEGVTWCSGLDNRTCATCGSLDGQSWGLNEPHPVPSLHWNCRCSILPKIMGWEELFKKFGGDTSIGRELDQIAPGDRASMGGPVSGKWKYEDWLGKQSQERQMAILGKGKYELFQKGKIGFTDLIDQSGNPLTLKQLQAIYG